MPGSVPRRATHTLTNDTLPYVLAIASQGIMKAERSDATLAKGVNISRGDVVNRAVTNAIWLPFRTLKDIAANCVEVTRSAFPWCWEPHQSSADPVPLQHAVLARMP
jgi:hypothetical protein